MAGTAVDVALYPLDTIKTRLQSPDGFMKAGGLRGVYNGLSAAAVGSAPGGVDGGAGCFLFHVSLSRTTCFHVCTLCM